MAPSQTCELNDPEALFLFFKYCRYCVHVKIMSEELCGSERQIFESIEKGESLPTAEFLKNCVPNAVLDYLEYSGGIWTLSAVKQFWRCHHEHIESPVLFGKVVWVGGWINVRKINKKTGETEQEIVGLHKPENLDLESGDIVTIHMYHIIEKIDKAILCE